MPFQSEKQRRWMHHNHPEMAKQWESETPKNAKLPEYVKGSAAAARQVKVRQGLRRAFPK